MECPRKKKFTPSSTGRGNAATAIASAISADSGKSSIVGVLGHGTTIGNAWIVTNGRQTLLTTAHTSSVGQERTHKIVTQLGHAAALLLRIDAMISGVRVDGQIATPVTRQASGSGGIKIRPQALQWSSLQIRRTAL